METKKKWSTTLVVCLVLVGIFAVVSAMGLRLGKSLRSAFAVTGQVQADTTAPTGDYYALIEINGTIERASAGYTTSVAYNHDGTLDYISELTYDRNNKGIFIDLDTPGGSVYETDELYLALMDYKEVTGRPIYAYMHSYACSGGYYTAMAADRIYANRNATTGSIGVIISLSNYAGLYDKLGISTDYIVTGANKAMGASDKALTPEQRAIYQSIVDEAFAQFTEIVCQGRGMTMETLLPLADGRVYTAKQALSNGLIDEITTWDEAILAFEEEIGCDNLYYRDLVQYSVLDYLFSAAEKVTPKSDAQLVQELLEKTGDNTPMYLYVG